MVQIKKQDTEMCLFEWKLHIAISQYTNLEDIQVAFFFPLFFSFLKNIYLCQRQPHTK